MNLKAINKAFHTSERFREQIAVLYYVDENPKEVTLLRSFMQVCQPGSASFDIVNSGVDTYESWKTIDQLVESGNVVGTFHTHPPNCHSFSLQDITAQNGLAKSNGSCYIWHGIQPVDKEVSRFVCVWMEKDRVFRHMYNWIKDDLNSPVIRLPRPFKFAWNGNAYELKE